MSRLKWDQDGERLYETGVEMGVLYPKVKVEKDGDKPYPKGVAWNGLINVNESPSGAEPTKLYADNRVYLNLMSEEEYGSTIEAYTYPDEFEECDGSKEVAPGVYAGQQNRSEFGMAYKTLIGNDEDGTAYGYKLHVVYGAKASPSEKAHATVNESPEAQTFSWEVSTTPVEIATLVDGKKLKPTASLTFDSTKADKTKLEALEDILFGGESTEAYLPLPDEIIALMGADEIAG